ncbi:MAG: GNAT family N-acetyltransferase, partial [Candidatus Binataceae bacterium]
EMLDAACAWLRSEGAQAVRSGFGLLEFPYLIDEYDRLGPPNVRINPPYYHAQLKDCGFESEKGWVDYRVEVTRDLVARYENAFEVGRRAGVTIAALRDMAPARRVRDFGAVWNEAFAHHWGSTPMSDDELAYLFASAEQDGFLDTDIIAYIDDLPVGALAGTPEMTRHAILKPGRVLAESEKLNRLGIGVRDVARGRGVNLAMASHLYVELIRRGAKYLSYTLVYDDNWPSRRTAEKLGATVCANYMVYRRPL